MSNTGIQQLIAAEKKAAERIGEARKRKARRLKQAKDEAEKEIEKYRAERERQFQEIQRQHTGSREDIAAKIAEDTRRRVEEIHANVQLKQEQVVRRQLELVVDVKPQLHRNYVKPR